MPRMYAVVFQAVAVSAQQDLFEILAPATISCELHSIYLSQHSDFGDAQDELLQVLIKQGATTTGSGGSTPTAIPTDFGDAASGATAKVNNTTKATAGTIVTNHAESFNVRAGWAYRPTPEERIMFRGGRRLTVELGSTPADGLTMDGVLYFRELG